MKLTMRKASLTDAQALSEILTQAVRYKLALGDSAWGTKPYMLQGLNNSIKKGNIYVALLGDEIIGTLMFLWEDEMVWGKQQPVAAYVHQLAIKNGHHGQGLGQQLLAWASKKAVGQGRELLRLDLPPQNVRLKLYYEKLGFKWVMDREVHAPHAIYTAALYERPIK